MYEELSCLQQRQYLGLVVVGHAGHSGDVREGHVDGAGAVGDLSAAGDVRIAVVGLGGCWVEETSSHHSYDHHSFSVDHQQPCTHEA